MMLETPIKREKLGCLCCGFKGEVLPMEKMLAVGFGSVTVTKNGQVIYDENKVKKGDDYWTVRDAERLALSTSGIDWRIHFYGPLWSGSFQRQKPAHWVLYEEGDGFA